MTDIVLFDGVCDLCARSVQFILRHESEPCFHSLVNKRYERFHLGVMNVGARIFGGGLLVLGAVFLLTAALSGSDHILFVVLGILAFVSGVAFLVVDPIRPGDIENLVEGKPGPARTDTYEKRK